MNLSNKILKKMLKDDYLTAGEVIHLENKKPIYDMFREKVVLLDGIPKHPAAQKDAYVRLLGMAKDNKVASAAHSQINKLKKILRGEYYKKEQLEIFKKQEAAKQPKSQKAAVVLVLKQNGSITSLEAFREFGITRLASIIYTLRKEGMVIETEDVTKKNRFGNPVTFAKYVLKK